MARQNGSTPGGIYSLERISKDSRNDYWTVGDAPRRGWLFGNASRRGWLFRDAPARRVSSFEMRVAEEGSLEMCPEEVGSSLDPGQGGWLGAIADPYIGMALQLTHERPERPWTPSRAAALRRL